MVTDILFSAKISKMGDNRIIWIPKSLSEMIKPFEDEKRVLVKIMSTHTKKTMAEGAEFVDKE
jgi:predicted transcriptional regulator